MPIPRPTSDNYEYPSDPGIMGEDYYFDQLRFKEAPTPAPEEKKENETCYQCGESVAWGSGRFVNRIPAEMPEGQEEWSKDPDGGWKCAECLGDNT